MGFGGRFRIDGTTIRERIDQAVPLGGLIVSVSLALVLSIGYIFGAAPVVPVVFGVGYAVYAAFVFFLRPTAQLMIIGGSVAMVAAMATNPPSEYVTLMLLTVVMLGMVAVTLADQWWPTATCFGLMLTLLAILDGRDRLLTARVVELVSLTAMLWVGVWLMWTLSRSEVTSAARNEALFERSPIPTWEIDYSAVLEQFEVLRANGVKRLADHFEVRPGDVMRLGNMVRILRANPAAITQFGLPTSRRPLAYLGEMDRDEAIAIVEEELQAVWAKVPEIHREFSTRLSDGRNAWTLQRWVPTRHRGFVDHTSVILVATDLSMQKEAARVLADQVRQKDEFIAAVSHELRTPLAVVVGLAQELSDNPEHIEAGEAVELVTMIANQSMDVAHIVEDLLVAARLDTGDITVIPEAMAVEPVVVSVVGDADVKLDLTDGLAALADPYRLRQILRNLLSNATRYGGPSVVIDARVEGRITVIEVRDDGAGVPEQLRERIFEPYERGAAGSDRRMSVGLGLTVSRQLAEMMGGTLDYRRVRGESVFRLRLPHTVISQANSTFVP